MVTFGDILRRRARWDCDCTAFIFLTDDGGAETRITYAELDQRARAVAALLQEHGSAGERVLILHEPGIEYIVAMFGCWYAGSIAVPCPRDLHRRRASRAHTIAAQSKARFALGDPGLRAMDAVQGVILLSEGMTDDDTLGHWRVPEVSATDVALLQFTSGSTSLPRGTMITHANLIANARVIEESFRHPPDCTVVSWLPPYHDMGLIGCILQPVFCGACCVFMSPFQFLRRPALWLETVSRFRAYTSGGPNFAYDLCVKAIPPDQRNNFDLSNWKLAFNAAEPIRHKTLLEFADTFAPSGFSRDAFYTCYGLAEATLYVSGGFATVAWLSGKAIEENNVVEVEPTDDDARAIVGCGRPGPGVQVAIVDPESNTSLADGSVGEIWVRGPAIAAGYWDSTEETSSHFGAHLANGRTGPFLRTGDLGFLKEGELFVTGRRKELIIIRGRNFYPHDIEQVIIAQIQNISLTGCAAFAIDSDGEERLIVAVEPARNVQLPLSQLMGPIRQAVSDQFDLRVHDVVAVAPAGLPRTSSGKIQRHVCKRAFLAGTLPSIVS